jgi:hypothetical protein
MFRRAYLNQWPEVPVLDDDRCVAVDDDPQIRRVEVLAQQLADANVYYDKFDRYYSGDQPLTFLAPEVAAQVGNRLAPMVINWPETITDSVNRRLR